jgi:hypothetical protein
MNKFNLQDLPLCGAKTRSGPPCKRYGNKTNGRCKLHGGHSTGAKTKEGKLALKANAITNSFKWFSDLKVNIEYLNLGITAYNHLLDLSKINNPKTLEQVILLVNDHRIELEYAKYYIAHKSGAEALALIQSALDRYYKDADAPHLHFHIYTNMWPTPYFNKYVSKAEMNAHLSWDYRRVLKGKFW